MDKLLLTVFLSSLAGFITAVLSIVKLVNEKENKTTEYRQSWTDSVRTSLALLVSNLSTQAANLVSLHGGVDGIVASNNSKSDADISEGDKRLNAIIDNRVKEDMAAVRAMRREIHHSYAHTRLHFKPNDISFGRIEQKFDVIMAMMDDFGKLSGRENEGERRVHREKIFSAVGDLTNYSRDILKTEWESVKKGEPAYQTTKRWSFIGGTAMLAIIFTVGIHALFVAGKSNDEQIDYSRGVKNSREIVDPVVPDGFESKQADAQSHNPNATQIINNLKCDMSPNKPGSSSVIVKKPVQCDR